MFRRDDDLIIMQSDHSRLAGELMLVLADALGIAQRSAERLAGAIAMHDWPHFGWASAEGPRRPSAQTDVIEIGKKTADQQRELVGRLAGDLPLDPFTELVVRLHWQRLTEDAEVQLLDGKNQQRIMELLQDQGLSEQDAQRLDGWTDLGDVWAFYLSRNEVAAGAFHLYEFQGDRDWQLAWHTSSDALVVQGVEQSGVSSVSLVAYEASGYPDSLTPVVRRISCKFAV